MSYFYSQTERDIAYNLLLQRLRNDAARKVRQAMKNSRHKFRKSELEIECIRQNMRIGRLTHRYYREANSPVEKAQREEVRQQRQR